MASPISNIENFIEEFKKSNESINMEEFKNQLYKKSIMCKLYEEDNLLLVYHLYNIESKTRLEQECRSLVIDTKTFKVISFSCPTPVCNKQAQQMLLNNNIINPTFFRCYEGSLVSLFHHNNKWYLSTRRCLNSIDSMWNEVSHFEMFSDVLKLENLSFEDFCGTLDQTKSYHFVLIHHKLKNIINYSNVFGDNYAKLCLAFVRDKETQNEDLNHKLPNLTNYTNIFLPDEVSMNDFSDENKNIDLEVSNEGVITNLNINNQSYLLKFQNLSYQFCKARGSEANIYKGYIYLYQSGILKQYLSNYENHKNYGKIVNPYNSSEFFDTVGVVDSVFKVLTSELFELFKMLWNFKTYEHLNESLYQILPKEYKDVLFALRGIYFQIRTNNINNQNKTLFGIKDIYNYLKNIDIDQLCALLRQRKLMFNWIISDKNDLQNLKNFRKISDKCDKVHSKLIAIYINKLFPEILSSDLPYQGVQEGLQESVPEVVVNLVN